MTVGRPSKYNPKYCDEVDRYLEENQDEEVKVLKQSNSEKGFVTYDTKLKVKLPTVEGFAIFIGVNKTTLYEWEKVNQSFSNSLDKIREEQRRRLLNSGLSGDYNSTIAKLILSSNHGMREKSDITSDDQPLTPLLVKFVDGPESN